MPATRQTTRTQPQLLLGRHIHMVVFVPRYNPTTSAETTSVRTIRSRGSEYQVKNNKRIYLKSSER